MNAIISEIMDIILFENSIGIKLKKKPAVTNPIFPKLAHARILFHNLSFFYSHIVKLTEDLKIVWRRETKWC